MPFSLDVPQPSKNRWGQPVAKSQRGGLPGPLGRSVSDLLGNGFDKSEQHGLEASRTESKFGFFDAV